MSIAAISQTAPSECFPSHQTFVSVPDTSAVQSRATWTASRVVEAGPAASQSMATSPVGVARVFLGSRSQWLSTVTTVSGPSAVRASRFASAGAAAWMRAASAGAALAWWARWCHWSASQGSSSSGSNDAVPVAWI